jgi:ABC-type multidrug transport system ATPase subunit
MNAYDLLKYFAKLSGFPRARIDNRIDELLKFFGLYKWKYTRVDKFSKGMKQKLGVIQAIIHNPDIIFLDEPQSGLDPQARIELRRFIKKLQQKEKTIFLSSHLLHEISEICNKIALINLGNIIKFDTIENLGVVLRTNELIVNLLNDISKDKVPKIRNKMTGELEPYLVDDIDEDIAQFPINYFPLTKEFRIYYDGKANSKAEILKILLKEFSSDFTITSYSQPKTHQLERIYEELIKPRPMKSNLKEQRGES